MSIFDIFKKKEPAPAPNQEQPFPLTDEQIALIWETMKGKTAQPSFELSLDLSRAPSVLDSKIGGLPYWNPALAVPHTPEGNKLALLAQLNMKDFPNSKLMPGTGILQFFIEPDDTYGINFDKPTEQSSFRIIYHETIDTSFSAESVRGQFVTPADVERYDLPFTGEFALNVQESTSVMGAEDFRFFDMLKNTVAELEIFSREEMERGCNAQGDGEIDKILAELEGKFPEDELYCSGSRVLGYPYFTQWDIRSIHSPFENYDVLLFQLDSYCVGNDWKIMWGDVGVANFFIRRADLLNKDFSNVIYNWDCC